jgi:hypothetical protein
VTSSKSVTSRLSAVAINTLGGFGGGWAAWGRAQPAARVQDKAKPTIARHMCETIDDPAAMKADTFLCQIDSSTTHD